MGVADLDSIKIAYLERRLRLQYQKRPGQNDENEEMDKNRRTNYELNSRHRLGSGGHAVFFLSSSFFL